MLNKDIIIDEKNALNKADFKEKTTFVIETNPESELAKSFILETNKSVFLTGKAGTGKTTLLKEILEKTDKNYIVAAPTGVAAINAGGMTLHSLFLLPLKSFLPIRYGNKEMNLFCDYAQLVKHQKFNRQKLDLLLELELLIIDEISMVRADIFDALDSTLRRVRKNQLPFGGVQLLVIGDLYQLAPVVRRDVQFGLSQYYKSPYFFDSLTWPKMDAVTVELDKVYRQADETFVSMLNTIRDGHKDEAVIEKLNSNYNPNPSYSNTITLTTHNRKADKINTTELEKLDTEGKTLNAKVTGKFPENAYPTPEEIFLKVGAQVMFIRNHAEELYFNGKIGVITKFTENTLTVKGDDGISIIVEPIEWKNSKYTVEDESGKIVKQDIGSFLQYPLRLAWAVTVHKSQGLTFDKVILDLESTFASGQLYVALSRCRSLPGLTLSSKINISSVKVDTRVKNFTAESILDESIAKVLEEAKNAYDDYRLTKFFKFDRIAANFEAWHNMILDRDIPSQSDCLRLVNELEDANTKITRVSANFISKIIGYLNNEEVQISFIEERTTKAIGYFTDEIHENLIKPIVKHCAAFALKSKTKTYIKEVEAVENALWKIIKKLYNIEYRGKKIYTETPQHIQIVSPQKIRSEKKPKAIKGETYNITLKMLNEKKSLALIAKERGLAVSTIEGHVGRLIKEQKVSIFDVMKEKKVEKALAVAQANPDLNLSELMAKLPIKLTFGQARWVVNYRDVLAGV